ncbi:MAG: radical SAM protein [Syntrophales bacterium]|nr:radical SAM protein [Syntrophales bacterium]
MRKRVLIVNPWIYDFAAYDYWLKPMGLLYLASLLRKNGIEVLFLDCLDPAFFDGNPRRPSRKPGGHGHFIKEPIDLPACLTSVNRPYHRYGVPPALVREKLAHLPPCDLILTGTTMTYWYPGLWELIKLLRELFPSTPIVMGGIYATLCPDHARKSGADFVLPGPVENNLSFIVKDALGMPLIYAPDLFSLDDLPYPAYDLLVDPDQVPILTSRGCPFHCPYCASRLLYPGFTRRNPDLVIDEIEWWVENLNLRNFSFYDDAFLLEADSFAVPFFREIIKRELHINLHFPNGLHVRAINSQTALLMRQAGVMTLRLGLETEDEVKQRTWGGKVFKEEFEAAVSYLKEAGYEGREIGVYILCGVPNQAPEEVLSSLQYVKKLGVRPILAEYSPIPGTLFWSEALKTSRFPLSEEPLFHNNSLLPGWSSLEKAEDVFRRIKSLAKKDIENI